MHTRIHVVSVAEVYAKTIETVLMFFSFWIPANSSFAVKNTQEQEDNIEKIPRLHDYIQGSMVMARAREK